MIRLPEFLPPMLEREYGEESELILQGYECLRPVTLRVNRLKAEPAAIRSALVSAGIALREVPWYEDAFLLPDAREEDVRVLPMYAGGEIYLQSLSSMLPPLLLNAQAGESVLDMAAAPGGKTTQIASLTRDRALITACERDKIRFERLRFNVGRQGVGRIRLMQADAGKLDDAFRFDKILLDAPCSGSGTFSCNRPVRLTEKLLAHCMKEQERLLRKGLTLLKKGGVLVYSTCSVLREENEDLLRRVLPSAGGSLSPLPPELFAGVPVARGEGCMTVFPDALYEGFFLAKIVK